MQSTEVALQKRAWRILFLMCTQNKHFVKTSFEVLGTVLGEYQPLPAAKRV